MAGARTDDRLRDKLVVVIGGSGFFGTHLAQELLARGARLRIASRYVERGFAIKPLGNLGQVQFARVDVTGDGDQLARAVAGADAVVNLVGAFSGKLDALQGAGAGRIAAAAKAAGAGAFVHVSALLGEGTGDVAYAKTKRAGEAAVLNAFPGATILRPSVLFGPDDKFITLFAGLASSMAVLPVVCAGATIQPIFVDDAAAAAAEALADPEAHGGKIFELAGPEVVTMLELNKRIVAATQRKVTLVPLDDDLSHGIALLTGWLPFAPFTNAQWKLLRAGNVASGARPGVRELGVLPRPMGLFLDRWLVRFRAQGRFGVAVKG
jgi:NADH dehydrogenase